MPPRAISNQEIIDRYKLRLKDAWVRENIGIEERNACPLFADGKLYVPILDDPSSKSEGSGDAGQFKKVDNEIVELRPDGPPVIRFKCVKAKDTPAAVNEGALGSEP